MDWIKHLFKDFKLGDDYIALFSLFISAFTLLLGYLAYKKFLVNQATIKQLDLVLKVIDKISKTNITITRRRMTKEYGPSIFSVSINLFGVNDLKEDIFNGQPMYQPENNKFELDLNTYISNPLLPKSLVLSINKLYQRFHYRILKPEELVDCVIAGRSRTEDEYKEDSFPWEYEGGFNQFSKDCKDVSKSIRNWLYKHGVTDINLKLIESPFLPK